MSGPLSSDFWDANAVLLKNPKRGVYLVDPGTDSNFNLLPLGVGLIAAYCRAQPALAREFDISVRYLRSPPGELASSLVNPAVVGLAAYVWNMQASLAYARAIRALHPGCLIVMGGASIPKRPERAREFLRAHKEVDVLVHGEGEISFAHVLEAAASGHGMDQVKGISGRDLSAPDQIFTGGPRASAAQLDEFPSPFLDGTFDGLMALHAQHVTGAIIESNRGCPYSCTFCDWGGADVHKIASFDLPRVKAEIDWVGQRGIPYIYLADANFGIFYERDLEIADHIASCRQRTGSPRYLGINFTKNSSERVVTIAQRIVSSGIQAGVTLAAQSLHPPTLAAIKRRNMDDQQLAALRRQFRCKGIVTYNDLILGLPEETLESFLDGIEKTMTSNLKDQWVVHLCNILENSEMADPGYMKRHGIETRTCKVAMSLRFHDPSAPQEEEVIVVGTKSMPRADWELAYDVAYLCAALHNFRAGFFVMNLLNAVFGARRTEFAAFLLNAVRAEGGRGRWAVIARGAAHLEGQRRMIMEGVARYSSVDALGGYVASPQSALLAIFLENAQPFYEELLDLTRRFLAGQGLQLDEALLANLFAYQSLRMTTWREPGIERLGLDYDLPAFFERLAQSEPEGWGGAGSMPQQGRMEVEVTVPEPEAKDRFAHARMRTRGERYTDILDCRVAG
jgi:radical SAM superfamily enzyme YgiQ (UPF0313 family)